MTKGFLPDQPFKTHSQAYGRLRRIKYAYRFIKSRAGVSPAALERTISRLVAGTYGIETELVKRMKARFRNELSFGEGK